MTADAMKGKGEAMAERFGGWPDGTRRVPEITASELARLLGTEQEPFLLDVREADEVEAWAIPGVVHIPLGELPARHQEVPRDRPVVTICAAGGRSTTAAEWLRSLGVEAASLAGGMGAWGQVYDAVALERAGARVIQVRRRGKGCLSYVVGAGDRAFVIDPSLDTWVYEDLAAGEGWQITHVFDTHLHADHLSGARRLAEETGATLHLNPADPFEFPFEPLADGQRFELPGGASLSVAAIHTPGHTEGSTLYLLGDQIVLTGDTLFVDGVGRPDLAERAEEFARNLHRSLQQRVLSLPEEALVLPAHYGEQVRVHPEQPVGATLDELRQRLEALGLPEDEFVAWAAARTTPRPPNYVRIVQANMGRLALAEDALRQLEAGPNRCAA